MIDDYTFDAAGLIAKSYLDFEQKLLDIGVSAYQSRLDRANDYTRALDRFESQHIDILTRRMETEERFYSRSFDNIMKSASSMFEGMFSGGGLDFSGMVGAGVGSLIGGPFGSVFGSVIENLLSMNDPDVILPSFELLWQTIDGQITEVTESWVDMGRDSRVFNAAEEFVQSQLDFFHKLTVVTGGGDVPDFDFSLGGLGRSIGEILQQQTSEGLIKTSLGASGQLSEFFGPGFKDELKSMFSETMGSLGMFALGQNQETFQSYLDFKFEEFSSLPAGEAMESFEKWMNVSSIFSPAGQPGIMATSLFDLFQSLNPDFDFSQPGGFGQLEQFAETQRPSLYTRGQIATGFKEYDEDIWLDFFTDLNQQITDVFDLVTEGMGEAFSASLNTGEFSTFENKFKQSILGSVQQGLIKGFAEQELLPLIFEPFYGDKDRPAYSEILKQYQSGDISLEATQGYLSQIFDELNSTMTDFGPVWELLNDTNQDLLAALGLNTDAVGANTTAVLGPVDAFLNKLDTSLADSQSLAGLQLGYNQRLTAAISDPKAFGEFSSYASQYYLPTAEGISEDYAGTVSGVRSDVTNIPWVLNARGEALTAEAFGLAIKEALAPMFLDLKDVGPITVQIVLDGQIIKQQFLSLLNDSDVAQSIPAIP